MPQLEARIQWKHGNVRCIVVTIVSYFGYSGIWGFGDQGKTAPPRESQFLKMANDWLGNVPFTCKLTNEGPIL